MRDSFALKLILLLAATWLAFKVGPALVVAIDGDKRAEYEAEKRERLIERILDADDREREERIRAYRALQENFR